MKCQITYEKSLGRGICYSPHIEGSGHYVRFPVWEIMVATFFATVVIIPFGMFVVYCLTLDVIFGAK